MIEISYISALIGGLLTFLAPCTLPLIPAYIAFISGNGHHKDNNTFSHARLMENALMFVIGFSVVFIFFGVISGAISKFLFEFRPIISQIGGVIIIMLGFSMLGVLSLPRVGSLIKFTTFKLPSFIVPGSRLGGFLLGFVFALGWSPCLGPVLGTILLLASTSGTVGSGALLLAVYSLGLAIPFLLVAYLYGKTFTYVTTLQKYLPTISKIGALMIIAIGMLLLVGEFGILNSFASKLLGNLYVEQFMQLM